MVPDSMQSAIRAAKRMEALLGPVVKAQEQYNRMNKIFNASDVIKLSARNSQMLKMFEVPDLLDQFLRAQRVFSSIRIPDNSLLIARSELCEQITRAFEVTIPYLSEDQQAYVRETISEELPAVSDSKFSLRQLLNFLNDFLIILQLLLLFLPDQQTEKSIELQEELITTVIQQQESSDKRFDDLQYAINTVGKTIRVLSEEIDALREENEILREQMSQMDDLGDSDIQGENSQALKHNDEP